MTTASKPRPTSPVLPATGFVRLPVVLQHFPVSRATWWQMVKDGNAPAAVKLGSNITAWRAEDIHDLIARYSAS